jgi:hypothetical protein
MPIFQRLLEAKWVSYARNMFYFNFLGSLIYMLLFTLSIILMPNGKEFYSRDEGFGPPIRTNYFDDSVAMFRLVLELTLILANVYSISEEFEEMVDLGLQGYFYGYGSGENVIQWVCIISFGLAVLFRLTVLVELENASLGVHAVTGWLYLMYYSKGFKEIGTLYLIFVKILFGDFLRFILLLSVFVLGFTEALWIQMTPFAAYYQYYYEWYRDNDPNSPTAQQYTYNSNYEDWKYLSTGLVWTLRFLFGQGSYGTV